MGGFARQTAIFQSVAGTKNLLKLHAGDALTGSLHYTFFKGTADAQMMNTLCFDAFTPGNHEFDDGDAVLKGFLDELAKGTCKTPTLSSNVVPATGTPLAPVGGTAYLKPWIVKAVGIATSSGSYPTVTTNKNGEMVCIGQAWEYSKAFGLMNLQFNDSGAVTRCAGKATLLIGDSFKRKDAAGAWQTVADNVRTTLLANLAANQPQVKVLAPDAAAATLKTDADQVALEKTKTIGTATDSFCLVRVPGESTSRSSSSTAGCEAANTLARGSDAAQVVAAGGLNMNTAFTLLPFTNVLVTNDFIAAGKDGYTPLGVAYSAGRYVNTYRLYTQSFVDDVLVKNTVARPARTDYSHQKVVTATGVILP